MVLRARGLWGCLVVSASAAAGTPFVVDGSDPQASDSSAGSRSAPWKTIAHAAASVTAGDTVVVRPGTYSGTVRTTHSGTSTARITFRAEGTVTTGEWVLASDYTTIDGFHLDGTSVSIEDANGCEVLNNDLVAGSISWATLAKSSGCVVKGNHLLGAVSADGDFPQINVFGTGHLIEGNDIGPSSDIDAFRIFGSNHVIRGNVVHDLTYSPGSKAHMDLFQTFGDNGWPSNNIVIENNRFLDSQGQLFNTSQDGVADIHDYVIRNNVFANIQQNANVGLPNMSLLNNTFFNTGIVYQVTGGPGKPFNGSNLVVKNNIFVGVAGCNNLDFDNVYNNPSDLPLTRASNFYSSCSGQALSHAPAEVGAVNGGLVRFVDAAHENFELQAQSPALGAGLVLSGFTTDLLGRTRPALGPWDLGAYQSSARPTVEPPTRLRVVR